MSLIYVLFTVAQADFKGPIHRELWFDLKRPATPQIAYVPHAYSQACNIIWTLQELSDRLAAEDRYTALNFRASLGRLSLGVGALLPQRKPTNVSELEFLASDNTRVSTSIKRTAKETAKDAEALVTEGDLASHPISGSDLAELDTGPPVLTSTNESASWTPSFAGVGASNKLIFRSIFLPSQHRLPPLSVLKAIIEALTNYAIYDRDTILPAFHVSGVGMTLYVTPRPAFGRMTMLRNQMMMGALRYLSCVLYDSRRWEDISVIIAVNGEDVGYVNVIAR